MSSFFARLLRSDKRSDSPQDQGHEQARENRKRQSAPSVESASERSGSLEKQQKVQSFLPIFNGEEGGDGRKSPRGKPTANMKAEKEARRKRNKRKDKQRQHSSKGSGFSGLFCMSGNSDTLERMPMPARKPANASGTQKKPMKIGGSAADKVVKRTGQKAQNRKFRHSAPIPGYLSVMSNGIEEEVAAINEQAMQQGGDPRNSTSSPVGYRFDGTLQRPYVFPGGLTFIAGRKNGKNYSISPDKIDPVEKARTEVPVDIHNQWPPPPGLMSETPIYHDGRTSWISMANNWDDDRSSDEDVRKQFTLKYDDRVPFMGESETSMQEDKHSTYEEVLVSSNTDPHPGSFPLRKGVSLEILNTESSRDSETSVGKGRYSLPQRDPSCVYMGSMENLTLLTLKRNNMASGLNGESQYFKSKQKWFNAGRKNHYSLPTLNHDFVCMGSFDDINLSTSNDTASSPVDDEEGPSPFQRMGRGRCSMSLPDLSTQLEYTLFDLPPVLSDSEGSTSDIEEAVNESSHEEERLAPLKTTPNRKDAFKSSASPFSRNLGRASCMPGNKRFFIPPPPTYTPPKDEMESVQSALSKLSCHKGSQVDISVGDLDLEMEDRDHSLKRGVDVKRLSCSLTDLTQGQTTLTLPGANVDKLDQCQTTDTDTREPNANSTDCETVGMSKINSEFQDSRISSTNSTEPILQNNIRKPSKDTQSTNKPSKNNETDTSMNIGTDTIPAHQAPSAAVTSTPKSSRKSITPTTSPSPTPAPRPVPRERKSLIKTRSMCLSRSDHHSDSQQHNLSLPPHNLNTPQEVPRRPVPRKRLSLPRPQSEIIETTSFENYLGEMKKTQERSGLVPDNGSTFVRSNDSVRTSENASALPPIVEVRNSDTPPVNTETPLVNTETGLGTTETNTSHAEGYQIDNQKGKNGDANCETRRSDTKNNQHMESAATQGLSSPQGLAANGTGPRLATPGPISSHRSYRLAIHKTYELDDPQVNSHNDSSASNDEDTQEAITLSAATAAFISERLKCEEADDEMSTGEDEVLSGTHPRKDILRSGSILDRSLILANKHRQRMRERKQTSSAASVDVDGLADFSTTNQGGAPAGRKSVTFFAEPETSTVNKSMDSGTFSDYAASPATSPNARTSTVAFAEGPSPRETGDGEIIDQPVRRQSSVQKKSWEVRLRRKHWMRKAGGSRENTYSWHCGQGTGQ